MSSKLDKVDAGHFEKTVDLAKVEEKILYKVCLSIIIIIIIIGAGFCLLHYLWSIFSAC